MVFRGSTSKVAAAALVAAILLLVMPALAQSASSPGAPTGLDAGPTTSEAPGCLHLTWQVADPSVVSFYRVYRSSRPSGGFEKVFDAPVEAQPGASPLMDYVDTGLDPSEHFYKVSTVDENGRVLGTTEVVGATAPTRSAEASGGAPFKSIIISVADQTIYFLEDNILVKQHLCSTGVDSMPTPTGVFSILYHEYLVISEKYGNAYCYWWMGFYPDTGMHALPYDPKSGTWTGGASLGHKASHGCVRQAVADAEWAYNWAPDGTRLDVIPQSYIYKPPPPPITGGHASKGVSQASNTWYLAEGCTWGDFNEYILMMNPSPNATNVYAQFQTPSGEVIYNNYLVMGLSRYTIHVDSIFGLEDTDVSTYLYSDTPIIAERAMYFDYNGKDDGSDSAGVPAPSTLWYLAEGYTGGDFDEFVLFQNPGDTNTTAHTTFMCSDGQNYTYDYPVNAHSRFTVHVDDVPGLSSAEVSTEVTSEQPIIVERSMYYDYYGRKGGAASAGVNEGARTWYLAEGCTGGEFDEYVLVQNPTDISADLKVTFMCGDGRNVDKAYVLGPRSRFSIHLDDIPELSGADVSTMVTANTEVIVERSMYFVTNGRNGGSDAVGVTSPAEYWYLTEGYTGGEFDSFVLILNPNDEETSVDVGFLRPGGSMKTVAYNIPAHTRFTIHVDDVEGMADTEFSTVIHSPGKPIICERAMYFSLPRM